MLNDLLERELTNVGLKVRHHDKVKSRDVLITHWIRKNTVFTRITLQDRRGRNFHQYICLVPLLWFKLAVPSNIMVTKYAANPKLMAWNGSSQAHIQHSGTALLLGAIYNGHHGCRQLCKISDGLLQIWIILLL